MINQDGRQYWKAARACHPAQRRFMARQTAQPSYSQRKNSGRGADRSSSGRGVEAPQWAGVPELVGACTWLGPTAVLRCGVDEEVSLSFIVKSRDVQAFLREHVWLLPARPRPGSSVRARVRAGADEEGQLGRDVRLLVVGGGPDDDAPGSVPIRAIAEVSHARFIIMEEAWWRPSTAGRPRIARGQSRAAGRDRLFLQ